jgi:hypothetical protein
MFSGTTMERTREVSFKKSTSCEPLEQKKINSSDVAWNTSEGWSKDGCDGSNPDKSSYVLENTETNPGVHVQIG